MGKHSADRDCSYPCVSPMVSYHLLPRYTLVRPQRRACKTIAPQNARQNHVATLGLSMTLRGRSDGLEDKEKAVELEEDI